MEFTNEKHKWFRLTHKNAKRLFWYLLILLCISLFSTLVVIFDRFLILQELPELQKGVIGSMSTALLGSTIFYSRKLYKACINIDMRLPSNKNDENSLYDEIRQYGIMLYYYTRPLFSIVFGMLTVLIIKSGVNVVADNIVIKNNFTFFVMVISFFVGFSSGDFIDGLELKGKKIATNVIDKSDTNG